MRRRPDLPPLAECRTCAEPIRFIRMIDTGKNLPVNPKPAPATGTVAAHRTRGPHGVQLEGYILCNTRRADPAFPLRFTVHHATCDRRPAPTPAPATESTLF